MDAAGAADAAADMAIDPIDGGSGDVAAGNGDAAAADLIGSDLLPACGPTVPFHDPVKLNPMINTAANEKSGRLSPDGLELYFTRDTNGDLAPRVFRSMRAPFTNDWGDPVEQTVFNIQADDGSMRKVMGPTLTGDGLTIYLQIIDGLTNFYSSTRVTIASEWGTPSKVDGGISLSDNEAAPWISSKGNTLYYFAIDASDITCVSRLYSAGKDGVGFNAGMRIKSINPDEDRTPVLTEDELTIYFSAFVESAGNKRIFFATRASKANDFQPLGGTLVSTLTVASGAVEPTWISPDGCSILFQYNNGPTSGYDLYWATKLE